MATSPGRTTDRRWPSSSGVDSTPRSRSSRSMAPRSLCVLDTRVLTGVVLWRSGRATGKSPSAAARQPGAGLFAVGTDGSGYRTILATTEGDGASLSPDGTKMAYQVVGRDEAASSTSSTSTPGSTRSRHSIRRRTRHWWTTRRMVARWHAVPVHQVCRRSRQPPRGRVSWLAVRASRSDPRCRTAAKRVPCGSSPRTVEGARALRRRRFDLAARPDRGDDRQAASNDHRPGGHLAAPGALTSTSDRSSAAGSPIRRAGLVALDRRQVEAISVVTRAILNERGHRAAPLPEGRDDARPRGASAEGRS